MSNKSKIRKIMSVSNLLCDSGEKIKKKKVIENNIFDGLTIHDLTHKNCKKISEGSYGKTYKLTLNNGDVYCLKKQKISNDNSIQNEIKLLSEINSDYVIKILHSGEYGFLYNSYPYYITKYIDMNLYHYMKSWLYHLNTIQNKIYIMKQLLLGLKDIHSANIIHGDIKPTNIMINSKTKKIKYIDFGLSIKKGQKVNHHICTLNYRPPESFFDIESEKYNFSFDIWSLGCVFYRI